MFPSLQEASVFILYKQGQEFEKLSKRHKDEIFEMLKKDPTHLARIRHPKILTLDHPVDDTTLVM